MSGHNVCFCILLYLLLILRNKLAKWYQVVIQSVCFEIIRIIFAFMSFTLHNFNNIRSMFKQDACYTGITRDAVADSFIPTVCFADL